MTNDDTEITPKLLLEHMQAMQVDLSRKIDTMAGRVDALAEGMGNRITRVEDSIQRLERKIDTLTIGVDAIDARLDAIEIEKLPHRVKILEARR